VLRFACDYASPVSDSFRAYDAMIFPGDFHVEPEAFSTGFADDEVAAMDRHVYLADELGRCSYFTEQERSMHFTMDEGTTTSFEMKLPGAGATRDMLGLLRQLFGTESVRASRQCARGCGRTWMPPRRRGRLSSTCFNRRNRARGYLLPPHRWLGPAIRGRCG